MLNEENSIGRESKKLGLMKGSFFGNFDVLDVLDMNRMFSFRKSLYND